MILKLLRRASEQVTNMDGHLGIFGDLAASKLFFLQEGNEDGNGSENGNEYDKETERGCENGHENKKTKTETKL